MSELVIVQTFITMVMPFLGGGYCGRSGGPGRRVSEFLIWMMFSFWVFIDSSVRNYLFLEKCLKNPFQSRLAYIACSHLLDEVIGSDYCFYIRNDDIQKFKTLDFDKFDEILDFGYEFAKVKITDDWVDSLLTKNKGIYGLTWPSDLISLLMAN